MTEADEHAVPDYPTLLRLDGRGFVVIGAGQGIGRQTAHALASVGARVLCVDLEPERAARAAREVRATALAPGAIWAPRVSASRGEEARKRNRANTPLGRVGRPADIAGTILFLVPDLSSYLTAQTLVVDGGVGQKFPSPPV